MIRCATITLRYKPPLAVQPLGADMLPLPGKELYRLRSRLPQPGLIHPVSALMSHWHSVTRLQQTANRKLGASSPLLRFYKASRSPATTSTRRITQPRNNKRDGEGMSVTAGPASHTAKTQRQEKDFGIKFEYFAIHKVYGGSSLVRCSHRSIS